MRGGLLCFVLVCAAAAPISSIGFAQPSPEQANAARPAAAAPPAEVRVLNRHVVTFRATVLGLTPADRAETARLRVDEVLGTMGRGSVDVVPFERHYAVRIDDRFVFLVAEGDANPLLDQTGRQVADQAARALGQVIAESHETRNRAALLRAAGWALVITLAYLLSILGLRALNRALGRAAARLAETQAEKVRVGGVSLVTRDVARSLAIRLLLAATVLVALLLTYEWLGTVLRQFPFTRPWGEGLADFLLSVAADLAHGIAGAIPGLFVAALIFLLARALLTFSSGVFERVRRGELDVPWMDRDTVLPTRRLFAILVWVFALAMAYPYLPGAQSEAFKGLSVLVGLMISLGGASTVAQGAGGVILMYARTFRVGDYVRIGDEEGTVIAIHTFQTRLRTGIGEEVILPNAVVLGSVVRNFSNPARGKGYVVDAAVTIGYDVPWRRIHALLEQAAHATPGVLGDPAPRVYQTELSDFYVAYRLVAQVGGEHPRPRAEVLTALRANVQDAFNEAGVQIMSPHYVSDPAAPKTVPKARWEG